MDSYLKALGDLGLSFTGFCFPLARCRQSLGFLFLVVLVAEQTMERSPLCHHRRSLISTQDTSKNSMPLTALPGTADAAESTRATLRPWLPFSPESHMGWMLTGEGGKALGQSLPTAALSGTCPVQEGKRIHQEPKGVPPPSKGTSQPRVQSAGEWACSWLSRVMCYRAIVL
jgi:hypothetical protein